MWSHWQLERRKCMREREQRATERREILRFVREKKLTKREGKAVRVKEKVSKRVSVTDRRTDIEKPEEGKRRGGVNHYLETLLPFSDFSLGCIVSSYLCLCMSVVILLMVSLHQVSSCERSTGWSWWVHQASATWARVTRQPWRREALSNAGQGPTPSGIGTKHMHTHTFNARNLLDWNN